MQYRQDAANTERYYTVLEGEEIGKFLFAIADRAIRTRVMAFEPDEFELYLATRLETHEKLGTITLWGDAHYARDLMRILHDHITAATEDLITEHGLVKKERDAGQDLDALVRGDVALLYAERVNESQGLLNELRAVVTYCEEGMQREVDEIVESHLLGNE